MGRGLHLGKIGGVEVILWGTAIVAAASFLAAVLVHELSRAWVGRARGVNVAW